MGSPKPYRTPAGHKGASSLRHHRSVLLLPLACAYSCGCEMQTHEERLAACLQRSGMQLPPAPKRGGVYNPIVQVGDLLYVSGMPPLLPTISAEAADGMSGAGFIKGVVGRDLSVAEGKHAARQTGMAILATLKAHLGSLNRVVRLVKTLGMVLAPPDFKEHPEVINGYSELMGEVFGEEAGIGARSAVGFGSLPHSIPVEIEAIFQVNSSEGDPFATGGKATKGCRLRRSAQSAEASASQSSCFRCSNNCVMFGRSRRRMPLSLLSMATAPW